MEKISLDDKNPLYIQIADYILVKIKDNTFKTGDIIPPERELSRQFNVSRVTVRKAIQKLVHSGHLYRVQGKGTFVFSKEEKQEAAEKKSKNIGVILDYSHRELESNMLTGIEIVLDKNNYSMTYNSSNNDYKREAETIQHMRNDGVSGLIILPAEDQKESTAIFDLKNDKFPFVLIDRRLQGYKTDCVMSDNIDGTYRATEYLIQLGHRRIAFIKNEFSKTSSIEDRITGYRYALREFGLDEEDSLIFSYDSTLARKEINNRIYNFINKKEVTAIVAMHDYVSLDVLKMCRAHGISIPRELSIIGFDNLDVIKHLEVPLTTVAQFPRKMGATAARLLMDKLKDRSENGNIIKQVYYPTKLIKRGSCAEPLPEDNRVNNIMA